jgi:type VI secretion system protein ImpI
LPDPFEQPAAGAFEALNRQEATKSGQPFDDPFSLDPLPAQRQDDKALNLFLTGGHADQPVPDRTASEQKAKPQSRPDLPPQMPPQASPSTDAGLREAFLRGLGFDGDEFPAADSIAQMESFGREYRMMLEGLIHLLRKRAEEKGEARIAQTVVGASEVNPLKFMPTVDDVIATFLAQRTVGFLPAEAAISGSIRDLAHHQVELRFPGDPPIGAFTVLPGVSDVVAEGSVLTLRVAGSITPVVREAANYDLLDFVSREPSLEETFLAQYGRGTAEAA